MTGEPVEPTHEDRLRTNYNRVGVAVMQALYSEDYLSLGGTTSTDELAELAGIGSESTVLDVGCGLGGPILHLASTVGCRVTGIDLVDTNIEQARIRAGERGLDHLASFDHGDATALPYGDASFDVVWGQDAWCHVPDKTALLGEAARVLRPGGTIAFTDWLADDGMSEPARSEALDAALCSTAASAAQYVQGLAAAGFVGVEHLDIGPIFCARYREICDGLLERRPELVKQFGERVYDIVSRMNGTILRGFEGGAIGGGRYVARKPG